MFYIDWLQEWAKIEVIVGWIALGFLALAFLGWGIYFITIWIRELHDERSRKRLKKKEKERDNS